MFCHKINYVTHPEELATNNQMSAGMTVGNELARYSQEFEDLALKHATMRHTHTKFHVM